MNQASWRVSLIGGSFSLSSFSCSDNRRVWQAYHTYIPYGRSRSKFDILPHPRAEADSRLGGGHAPDIITVCGLDNVLPSSTNPTRPYATNTLDEHLDVRLIVLLSKTYPLSRINRCLWCAIIWISQFQRTWLLQSHVYAQRRSQPRMCSMIQVRYR